MSANIAIFVPHAGCKHKCSFCNQNSITGSAFMPHASDVRSAAFLAKAQLKDHQNAEIAFFGGSFTAIPQNYMNELLDAAYPFIADGSFAGIRISTRPDCIDDDILDLLHKKGVIAIELGAQSMNDEVLRLNERGHSSQDVVNASRLIKKHGFELGLQMMTGLYGSNDQIDFYTARRLAELTPETVRIYPTIVLPKTTLAELFEKGEYVPQSLENAVELCSELLLYFKEKNITVIKLGLHASEDVKTEHLAGPYHPAFRELCENKIYLKKVMTAIDNAKIPPQSEITLAVRNNCISKMVGQNKSNIRILKNAGYTCRIAGDDTVNLYEVKIEESVKK